ncbi:hypothetical protein FQN57_003009 [Myotisia sp. PD_48]|nr:hypothetical protein FQN57_003009 [Myotisia sp. PD_48]
MAIVEDRVKSVPKPTKRVRSSVSKAPTKGARQNAVSKRMEKEKLHRRSRNGCFTCRLRRKKCDEGHPSCQACNNLGLRCEYERPVWWANNEQRRSQKEYLKGMIKATKINEKTASEARTLCCTYSPPALSHSVSTPETFPDTTVQTRDVSPESLSSFEENIPQFCPQDSYDPMKSQLQTPHFDSASFFLAPTPYEVDVKTESELFINDIQTRRDSSISTFNTFQPPLTHAMLPSFVGDDWVQREIFESHASETSKDSNETRSNSGSSQSPPQLSPAVHVEPADRYLLDSFFEDVVGRIFPVCEARKRGTVCMDVILPAIESSKGYLHTCLSTAAVHLKATGRVPSEKIDSDILKHRYQSVAELCADLNQDSNHVQILDATLGMTFFNCAVGRSDDNLPDIPWHQHFQAATSLIHRLELPRRLLETDYGSVHPPFNMSLAAWIDILGSTMLGQMPQFSHTYRTKLFGGTSTGLCDLMGCEDRVMYLIAEISCLDALNIENRVDHIELCSHITNLAQQLDQTEPPKDMLVSAISDDGILDAQQLSKNITALFRVAARVYLCSLVPGFHSSQPGTSSLVSRAAEFLDLIPCGPNGFDASLVWPLLICGSFSCPGSTFRQILNNRVEQMGERGEFGSFGRMIHVLKEVWRLGDGIASFGPNPTTTSVLPSEAVYFNHNSSAPRPDGLGSIKVESQEEYKPQQIHWRDVMRQNRWEFLLV